MHAHTHIHTDTHTQTHTHTHAHTHTHMHAHKITRSQLPLEINLKGLALATYNILTTKSNFDSNIDTMYDTKYVYVHSILTAMVITPSQHFAHTYVINFYCALSN